MLRRALPVFSIVGFAACHPLACCAPGDLPRDKPLVVASSSAAAPGAPVDLVLDELGVPHIYGENEVDLSYALGFIHGRDRQFQVYVYVHASEGRLTELLGEDLLPIDRQNRLLTFRIDEQEAALGDRDRGIIEAYRDGINDGAVHTGRSAEMAILGVEWEPLDVKDILSVVRLQQWDQSVGFGEEMVRWRLAKALGGTDDPRYRELTADTPSGGTPIVTADDHSGDAFTSGVPAPAFHAAPSSSAPSSSAAVTAQQKALVSGVLKGVKLDIGGRFGRGGVGASNSWVVDGAHNSSGVPVLCNDPHLGHAAPGVFYMVHMESPDFTIAGGSFPGIPAVLIGHGRHIAWGITNAYADVEDVVVLRPYAGNDDLYLLDGVPMNYTRKEERFKIGKDAGAVLIKEDYRISVFGPVLPEKYGTYDGGESWVDDGERLALQWSAFAFPEKTSELLSSFWTLAQSKTIEQATAALQTFIAPSMSVVLAISESDEGPAGIHYRLGGLIPVRGGADSGSFRVDFPHDGATRDAGFTGVLDVKQKPQLDDPAAGFIIAANQRIVDNDVLSQRFVGFEGAKPFRALRIRERLEKLLEDGDTPSPAQLLAIQQDVESIEARELAPILGKHCPGSVDGFPDDVVARFCDAVGEFDGVYSADSVAIPFVRLYRAVTEEILLAHVSRDLAEDAISMTAVQMSIFDMLQRADGGESFASFDLDDVVAKAAESAMWTVQEETGMGEADWRWAKLHQLAFRGVLARAPVIGGLFVTGSHEESGNSSAPRAEGANFFQKLRVDFGAGLRNFAIMKEQPEVRMVNDIGQSGHFGSRHLEDQYPLWTKGEPYIIQRDQDDVTETNDGLLQLVPKD